MRSGIIDNNHANEVNKKYYKLSRNKKFQKDCARKILNSMSFDEIEDTYFNYFK